MTHAPLINKISTGKAYTAEYRYQPGSAACNVEALRLLTAQTVFLRRQVLREVTHVVIRAERRWLIKVGHPRPIAVQQPLHLRRPLIEFALCAAVGLAQPQLCQSGFMWSLLLMTLHSDADGSAQSRQCKTCRCKQLSTCVCSLCASRRSACGCSAI